MNQLSTYNALIVAGTHAFELKLDDIPGLGDHVEFDNVEDGGGELVSGSFVVASRQWMLKGDRSYVLIEVSSPKGLQP